MFYVQLKKEKVPKTTPSWPSVPLSSLEDRAERIRPRHSNNYKRWSVSSISNTPYHKKIRNNTVITMTGASSASTEHKDGVMMMLDENHVTEGDLLLCEADFPANYVHMAHPDDYKSMDTPLPITCLLHRKIGHWRLILRVSFRLMNGKYLPMSFVCDTCAP